MKIVLFGCNGQVGFHLQDVLKSVGKVIAFDRKTVDIADFDRVREVLLENKPEVIVNAAAYTAVDKAETETELADIVNHQAVRVMAEMAKQLDALLVHYSTDYVFDGEKTDAYTETDAVNPLSVYGKTKFLGEEAIREVGCKHFIIRTSWVYCFRGNNFIKTIIRLARDKEEIKVVDDQIGAPTSAEFLAKYTIFMIEKSGNKKLFGTYNLVPDGAVDRYELSKYIVDFYTSKGGNLKLKSESIQPVSSDDFPLPAERPKNSVLSIEKFCKNFAVKLPIWQIDLEDTLNKIDIEEVA